MSLFLLLFFALPVQEWNIQQATPTLLRLDLNVLESGGELEEPACARLVPVPSGRLPHVTVTYLEEEVRSADCQSEGLRQDLVTWGQPARAAGLDVVPLVVALQRKCEESGRVVVCRRAQIELRYEEPILPPARSNAMTRLLQELLTGDKESFPVTQDGYLIIVPDDFYSHILPLAVWKERKGFKVWVKKTSETGTSAAQIRTFISNAYKTWDPVPSYVLLVGAVNKIPAFHYSVPQHVSDNPFVCVDGDDFLPDLFVGRLPAANASELDVMVAKILGYERTPYLEDTLWYGRALMVGTSYQEGGTPAVTALVTKRVIRTRMLAAGYSHIDTVFYPPTRYGRGPVDSAVNRGVSLINGRGWGNYDGWGYPQYLSSDVNALNNGWKLPVVTSIYCGTGNYARNPCFGEVWLRAGTPTSPKGGVAFWGASWTGTSTRWNNCMDYGIYHAIFDRGVHVCGPAMYYGKLEQLVNFPLPADSFDLRCYFQVYNLLGDPSLEMRTRVPTVLSVSHPAILPVGASTFDVVVTSRNGPVREALVCLYKQGELHLVARTDAAGRAHFAFSTVTADTMHVTVTGDNMAPYIGYALVQPSGLFVGYASHTPSSVQPAALAELTVSLRNFGSSLSASNVVATLRALDTLVSVVDSVRNYGALRPGEVSTAAPFVISVAPSCTSSQILRFEMSVSTGDSVWKSAFNLDVQAPTLDIAGYLVHDGNGVLDPGETAELSVVVKNRGKMLATGVTAVLSSLNPGAISVVDSLGGFGDIAPAESVGNVGDRFVVRAAASIGVGRKFTLRLTLRTGAGARQVRDFTFTVGRPFSSSPLGPDKYGYYAYDDTDSGYAERPGYEWVEIDPTFGGRGTKLVLGNDQVVPVSLPFTFRFYGRAYDRLGVCDNGYISFDDDPQGEIYNWHLPSACAPDGLIAPFWDDFRADTLDAGGVFTYYDATGHRFIVEWSRCVHVHGFRPPILAERQTFQAILYDPQYHRTATGDGAIVFQYLAVQNDDSLWSNSHNFATVGIMSPEHLDGLEYTFAGRYPPAAAEIVPGRVVRFTTNPPDTFTGVKESLVDRKAGNRWFLPNPVRARQVSLPLPVGWNPGGQVEVYDALGRCVVQRPIPKEGQSIMLDLRTLSGGVYTVSLSISGRIVMREKLLLLPQR